MPVLMILRRKPQLALNVCRSGSPFLGVENANDLLRGSTDHEPVRPVNAEALEMLW